MSKKDKIIRLDESQLRDHLDRKITEIGEVQTFALASVGLRPPCAKAIITIFT